MRIVVAAAGRLKAGPERELCSRYMDRAQAASRSAGLTGVEMREIDESRARRPQDRMAEESQALLAHVPPGARLVLLDERGKTISSEAFARDVGETRDGGAPAFVLALGGPDGHGPDIRARADIVLSFGSMTWPHQLARIMAAEQVYRAITILTGHPYHRS